jgi:hypothetical protein
MNTTNFLRNATLVFGLLVAGSSLAADQIAPVTPTPEQRTEMQKKREQKMEQKTEKDGQGEMIKHREMHQERVNERNVSGAGNSRSR